MYEQAQQKLAEVGNSSFLNFTVQLSTELWAK